MNIKDNNNDVFVCGVLISRIYDHFCFNSNSNYTTISIPSLFYLYTYKREQSIYFNVYHILITWLYIVIINNQKIFIHAYFISISKNIIIYK